MKHLFTVALAAVFMVASGASAASTDYFLKIKGIDGETTKTTSEELSIGSSTSYSGVVGKPFVLDATRSTDDGAVRTFAWKQVSGPTRFADQKGTELSFTPSTAGTYVFELVVTDRAGKGITDLTVKVNVTARVAAPVLSIVPNTLNVTAGSEEEKKGNVEYGWKVEEGESAPGIEPDDIDANDDSQPITPDFSILLGGGSGDDEAQGLGEEKRSEVANIILEGLEAGDRPVESISLNYEKLTATTRQPVRFLGIFKMEAEVEVEIDAEERVKVKFPWWAYLSSGRDADNLGQGIFTAISNVLKTKHDTVKNAIGNIR